METQSEFFPEKFIDAGESFAGEKGVDTVIKTFVELYFADRQAE